MPTPLFTTPGVYLQELPSGVRTILGVSTSDTAFVDYFRSGPLDVPVRITSPGDFDRVFGGLDPRSEASYAIQQFFLNGGQVAWVVRVAAGTPRPATLDLTGGSPPHATLTVAAANAGTWGRNLSVAVDWKVRPPIQSFNLAVRLLGKDASGRPILVASESFLNLSMNRADVRYAPKVVNNDSTLVRLTDDAGLGELPTPTGADVVNNPQPGDFHSLDGAASDGDLPGAPGWDTALIGSDSNPKSGMHLLDTIEPANFSLLCIPSASGFTGLVLKAFLAAVTQYCQDKRAFFIVDIPPETNTPEKMVQWMSDNDAARSPYAAVYFPRLLVADPLDNNRPRNVGAAGTMAGIFASTDATRGVWKAPAGTAAQLRGAALAVTINDPENGQLNPLGVNAIRAFPVFGTVGWGARTLNGADLLADQWKYIPVRRTASYIEESLIRGLKSVVFEPNDDPLWAQIRLNVGAFMQDLFRQGAFQGKAPAQAYFVKCDGETTTQQDIDRGIVNIVVGFAPLKPAEFVVLKIQQMTGQSDT